MRGAQSENERHMGSEDAVSSTKQYTVRNGTVEMLVVI